MNTDTTLYQWLFITFGSFIFTGFLIYSVYLQNETALFIGIITYLFFVVLFFMITSNMGDKRFEKKNEE